MMVIIMIRNICYDDAIGAPDPELSYPSESGSGYIGSGFDPDPTWIHKIHRISG